jgi:hypothetical protein
MSESFKTSVIWVVDFRFDGRARGWPKTSGTHDDVRQAMVCQLETLYGDGAKLIVIRNLGNGHFHNVPLRFGERSLETADKAFKRTFRGIGSAMGWPAPIGRGSAGGLCA